MAYPLTPDCPPCGAVAPQANRGIRCHGLGGQGAWQPSLRSGRLRRPARAEWDNSRRRTPCPQCLAVTSWAGGSLLVDRAYSLCVRLLGWAGNLPTSQQTLSVSLSGAAAGLCGFIPAAFQSSVSSPCGCSSLRTIPAGVGTFLLPALSHSALQTTAGYRLSLVRVSDCSGGQASLSTSHPTRGNTKYG